MSDNHPDNFNSATDLTATSIPKLLEKLKELEGVDDVRFRVRDWKDQSIVYVPGWVLGQDWDKKEPALAQRYYRHDGTDEILPPDAATDLLAFDCYVGLKALMGRCVEESSKDKDHRDESLLENMRTKLAAYGYACDDDTIYFNYSDLWQKDGNKIFLEFQSTLKNKLDYFDQKRQEWTTLETALAQSACNTSEALRKFIENYGSPPLDGDIPKKRWLEVVNYLCEPAQPPDRRASILTFLASQGQEIAEPGDNFAYEVFKRIVSITSLKYSEWQTQWRNYGEFTTHITEELAIPVAGYNCKFFGVLNLHKYRKEPSVTDESRNGDNSLKMHESHALKCAHRLSLQFIQRQVEQLDYLQDVTRKIAAGTSLPKIATEICSRIRDVLKDGLDRKEVFPMLHILPRPADREDQALEEEWSTLWEDSYKPRERLGEDDELWTEENELGTTPIRNRGLGKRVVGEWRNQSQSGEEERYFVEELFVDNLDRAGSVAAHFKGIQTTGCFALIYGQQLHGLLYIHCKKRHFFTEMEVKALSALAAQTAIAIKNARPLGRSYAELYGVVVLDELEKLETPLFGNSRSGDCQEARTILEVLSKWRKQVLEAREIAIVDSVVTAIKELSRRFGLPREFSTYYIEEYKSREGALQSIETYREHFVHPFHVFLLGYIILAKCAAHGSGRLLQNLKQQHGHEVLKTWFLVSIYHDVGLPAEKLPLLVMDIFGKAVGCKVGGLFDWGPVVGAEGNYTLVEEISQRYGSRFGNDTEKVLWFKRWFYHRLLEKHDHGALSSLMLLKRWPEGQNPDNAAYEAALAIALHNLKVEPPEEGGGGLDEFDIRGLAVESFPLAFFLQYCDCAQEWGRRVYHRQLEERLPTESQIQGDFETCLQKIECTSAITEVVFQYTKAKWDNPIVGGKTLKDLFNELRQHFQELWNAETNIRVIALDSSGDPPGGFYRPRLR